MPLQITEKEILIALHDIIDPLTGKNVVDAGLISGVVVKGGKIGLMITIARGQQESRGMLRQAVHDRLILLEGVEDVTAVLTAEHEGDAAKPQPAKRATWNLTPIENVTRVIAVASGKGGVGKSTMTASLALALAREGQSVGIVDADIYGPSMPHMFGLKGKPDTHEGKMIPPQAGGVQIMSIGLLLDDSQAAIMRGPMISKALNQLVRGTIWGSEGKPLDVLLIDMPPGTGDVHLSLVQNIPLAHNGGGAVIVTTPQEVALIDTRKCVTMFEKTHVPILGVIENMSYFEDASGVKQRLFGQGGGAALAMECGADLLAEVPLLPGLREAADVGGIADHVVQHNMWHGVAKLLIK